MFSSEIVTGAPSRRTLLRSAGIGAAALAVTGAGSLTREARASTSGSALGAVADYLASRAAANDPSRAATTLASASGGLARYELERARYMRRLGQRFDWNGRILGLDSTPAGMEIVSSEANHAVVRLYETVTIDWVPNPRPTSKEFEALHRAEPEKFGLGARPGRTVSSGIGTEHELRVERSASGWVVVADAYAEPDLFGESPDVANSEHIRGVSAQLNRQTAVTATQTTSLEDVTATSSGSYDFSAAITYAMAHSDPPTYPYNNNYVNYNACGGDCANFVSQCFYKGTQATDGTWYRYNGNACGFTNRWCGSTAWVNNWSLRNWVINAGRGVAKSSIGALGSGDIVNYDWTQNGSYDHVTIVTDAPTQLICSHNSDRRNVPWQMGDTTANHTFTFLYNVY